MALEEKVSILPIIQENGHPIKGMLHFSESHLEAARTPHTADLALVSAVEATLQNEAKHIHSISLNIESPRVLVPPTNGRMKEMQKEVKRDLCSL
jgi:hypothetical protein